MTGWVVDASVCGSRFFADGLEVPLPGLEEQVASEAVAVVIGP